MMALMDPTQTPKVPKSIRERARARLKHFPSDYDVRQLEKLFETAESDPKVLIKNCFDELASINASNIMTNKELNKIASVLSDFPNKINR